jgi:hypothetical protein
MNKIETLTTNAWMGERKLDPPPPSAHIFLQAWGKKRTEEKEGGEEAGREERI